jgi:hypothetical protein
MTRLGIGLHVKRDKIQTSLNQLTPWPKRQIKPIVWARDRNWGSLQVTPIKVQLKTGEIVRRKQYPIPMEGNIGLKPIIEGPIRDGLLEPCTSPINTSILPVKKMDGSYQLVQDLRTIKQIVQTKHPVVLILEQVLEKIMLDPHMCLLQYVDNLLLSGIIGKR